MGLIRTPLPVKLFIGMLSPEPDLFAQCARIISSKYGSIDFDTEIMPWTISDYYQEEMGNRLFRKFYFFKELIDQATLATVKNFTNQIEEQFSKKASSEAGRRINLDPGYVTEAKVVLASTKDFAHRIYIGKNIYAEVTLRYSNKARSFSALEHTYFDFRMDSYISVFNQAREILRRDMAKGS